jgi:pyruvate kinase
MVATVEKTLIERGLAQPGDSVVFTAGTPLLESGTTNLIKLHRIGETQT